MSAYNLPEWVDYIQSLHARSIDLSLERVDVVYQRLAISLSKSTVITLGGTNGKGSSQAMLESIYRHHGYSTATYSSPHLVDYNERIKINNVPVSDEVICQAFSDIEKVRGDITLTFFEYGTLAAFWVFAHAKDLGLVSDDIDVILLETGMGGRKDAVNIIRPDAVLITNIGLDHVQWLGNDRESIAYEKAGLFKKGVFAICNDTNPPNNILLQAKAVAAPLYLINQNYQFESQNTCHTWQWRMMQGDNSIVLKDLPVPNIKGGVQTQNAAAVLTVVHLLSTKLCVSEYSIKLGLQNVGLAGRLQSIRYLERSVLLDVAHNADSFAQLDEFLANHPIDGNTIAVFGMLSDKDIDLSLKQVTKHVSRWFLSSIAGERSGDANLLEEKILNEDNNVAIQKYETVEQAFVDALSSCQSNDRIIVIGSFHIVGDVLKYIRGN